MKALQALLFLLAVEFWAGDAAAHATLLSTSPADGSSLAEAPAEIVLRFDEPVAPMATRLVDDSGAALTLANQGRSEGPIVRVALPATMSRGAFVLSYRVVSADSHPVVGSIAFTIGETHVARSPVVQEAAGSSSMGPAWTVVRGLRDVLLLAAIGAALFVLGVGPFPFQRLVLCVCGLAAAVLSMLGVGLQGAAMTGQTLGGTSLQAAMRTSAGASSLVTVASAIAISIGGFASRRAARGALLWLGAIGAPVSLALTGHAASAHPAWLSMAAVAGHVLTAGFWAGSLIGLYSLLRCAGPRSSAALRRFSAIAMPAVTLLLVAGSVFAVMQLTTLRDLFETRYGNLILAKAGLLFALLAIAARNRFVLMPRSDRAVPGVDASLRRSVALELALIAVVVGFTAVLSQTPPHADSAISKELGGAGLHRGKLTMTPGRAGRNNIVVELRDDKNQPLDPVETILRLSSPSAGVEAIDRELTRVAAGVYRYEGNELSFPGAWSLSVRARVGDFDQVEMQTTVTLH